MPAHDARWNLVAEREQQHGRVVAEFPNLAEQLGLDLSPQLAVVEEGDVLRPGEPDHDAQAMPLGCVEQFTARRRVHPHGVDSQLRHETEVLLDLLERGELMTVGVGCEGAVGDPLDVEARVSRSQELAVDRHGGIGRNLFTDGTDGGVDLEGNAHGRESLPVRQNSILPPKRDATTQRRRTFGPVECNRGPSRSGQVQPRTVRSGQV